MTRVSPADVRGSRIQCTRCCSISRCRIDACHFCAFTDCLVAKKTSEQSVASCKAPTHQLTGPPLVHSTFLAFLPTFQKAKHRCSFGDGEAGCRRLVDLLGTIPARVGGSVGWRAPVCPARRGARAGVSSWCWSVARLPGEAD